MGKKHILVSWWAMQYFLLTICFLYYLRKWKAFFESFARKLGITCSITADIWLLSCFLNKLIWKTRYRYFLYKSTKNRKNLLIWRSHVRMTKAEAYRSDSFQLLNHFSPSIVKKCAPLSATSVPSPSPMAYNTPVSLDKLTCTDHVDFGKLHGRFGFFWSCYLDVKLKVLKRDDNRGFRRVHDLTPGEANFKQIMRLRNQLVIAAEKFGREENLSPLLIPTVS